MRMTSIEHQREIDADQIRQFAEERADQEREAEEANASDLFNIPPFTWTGAWRRLHDPATCREAVSFWHGVLACCSSYDRDFGDRHMLAVIAFLLAEGK